MAKQNKLNVKNDNLAKTQHSGKAGSISDPWEMAGIWKKLKFDIYISIYIYISIDTHTHTHTRTYRYIKMKFEMRIYVCGWF